jgi:hypothetical protein
MQESTSDDLLLDFDTPVLQPMVTKPDTLQGEWKDISLEEIDWTMTTPTVEEEPKVVEDSLIPMQEGSLVEDSSLFVESSELLDMSSEPPVDRELMDVFVESIAGSPEPSVSSQVLEVSPEPLGSEPVGFIESTAVFPTETATTAHESPVSTFAVEPFVTSFPPLETQDPEPSFPLETQTEPLNPSNHESDDEMIPKERFSIESLREISYEDVSLVDYGPGNFEALELEKEEQSSWVSTLLRSLCFR